MVISAQCNDQLSPSYVQDVKGSGRSADDRLKKHKLR